ncbi:DNA helicase RecQ [Zunongwangia profunda]|uniref:DNA helicase RecQ n=1 Tax=Zunongwangia profunda TaxID=398743 RepID=A0A3D5J064_9FLAO|nr:DNA helicase RecQ [Zunongwangia profunda]MAS69302.1 DNA helicase RecQ [Zunongwangia sp.]MAS71090.1 DNA helicase RecQ [Zunongwangia sp.]HAJ82581.1 DNA helicase RecQ [Zunongwangia profunda]HCV81038.1 DNA helicase RecQ [Zunongwangia profunda]|tara:strand:- start:96 stop:2204 length:2109 start_codon:yes stop_codon:yes gene_type:complete
MEKQQLLNTLKEYFGYDSFRPLQEKIIQSIFDGKDNLVIMPTGGGKSICYQLPAILLPKLTIVISPLIALMKDQVDGLKANGIKAEFLNSSQQVADQESIFQKIDKNELKLLYVAPESLQILDRFLTEENISLIAIDEAHCISSWGHDFRPAYTQLGYLKKRFSNTPIIALTATADKATRHDICQQLNIPDAKKHISSFDRKNLSLEVRQGIKRFEQIIKFIKSRPSESGIIYCLSRKNTEELAEKLQQKGLDAKAYHAGLKHEERESIQDDFINDKTEIICATVAFGMGIDKSNIRWVIHYNMPKNLEGYYQEIGRAGRDGLPSDTLLFHSYADVVQLQRFAENTKNKDIQVAKLDRMKQYAEALTCRRKILLSYFGEIKQENCGNCDICKNPPQFFDGTVASQKALSCIYRLKGKESITTVVDVLRGSQNEQTLSKNYNRLKTYGIGKDISWNNWQQYILQLINLGYAEIAFHQGNALKLTKHAKDVLFEGKKVHLAKVPDRKLQAAAENNASEKVAVENSLFEKLRQLRLDIAREEEIPAYLIFNDATLKEMERARPMTDDDFMLINGVGRKKMEEYGYRFIKEIIAFSKQKRTRKKQKKGKTYKITGEMYAKGKTPEEIAKERELSEITIMSHLLKLYDEGESIDLNQFIGKADLDAVRKAKKTLGDPDKLKPYFEHFEEAIPYNAIKIALKIIENEQ